MGGVTGRATVGRLDVIAANRPRVLLFSLLHVKYRVDLLHNFIHFNKDETAEKTARNYSLFMVIL